MPQFEACAEIPVVNLPALVSREMLVSYLETAEWVGIMNPDEDASDSTLNDVSGYEDPRWSVEATKQAATDLENFLEEASEILDGLDDVAVGHNFWLSRCGHGAGFFDLGIEHGDELQEIARRYGDEHALIGEDGLIEFMGG